MQKNMNLHFIWCCKTRPRFSIFHPSFDNPISAPTRQRTSLDSENGETPDSWWKNSKSKENAPLGVKCCINEIPKRFMSSCAFTWIINFYWWFSGVFFLVFVHSHNKKCSVVDFHLVYAQRWCNMSIILSLRQLKVRKKYSLQLPARITKIYQQT